MRFGPLKCERPHCYRHIFTSEKNLGLICRRPLMSDSGLFVTLAVLGWTRALRSLSLPSPLPLWCANPSATATSAGPLVFKQRFAAYLQYPRVVISCRPCCQQKCQEPLSAWRHVPGTATCACLQTVLTSLLCPAHSFFYSRFPSLLEIELIFRQPLSTRQLKWWSVFPANCISFYTILSVCKIFMFSPPPPRPLPPFKNYAWGWVVLIPLRRGRVWRTGCEGPVLKCGFEGRVLNLAVGPLNGWKRTLACIWGHGHK